jgi:hypothetical protein
MAETSKAIGLRLPADVWEKIREYGIENYPSDKSKEGIDVTQSIVSLLRQALGISLDTGVRPLDDMSNKRITEVEERLKSAEESISTHEQTLTELKKLVANCLIPPSQALPPPGDEAMVKDYLIVSEVATQTGLTRQAIEKHRGKGTLSEVGYRAEKIGANWKYYPLGVA